MNKTGYAKLLDEACKDSCPKQCGEYCFLKEIVLSTQSFDPRAIFQIKLLEIYKFNKSKELKKDIGMDRAWELWIEEGHAKLFGDIYNPITNPDDIKLTPKQVYELIMHEKD